MIGLEFASIFRSFGSEVTVLEYFKEILPRFDSDLSKRLKQSLGKRGIDICTQAQVTGIQEEGGVYIMKRNVSNELTLKFPSRSCNEGFARTAIACFASQMDPTLNELEDIKTSVSEAVTNAIVHAYPDSIGTVTVVARICAENVLEMIVKDRGRGIGDIEKARQPMFTTGGEDRSGMGFTIMESFMDQLSVRSIPGRGTTVIMKKKLAPRVNGNR